jgi:hypothetical protein
MHRGPQTLASQGKRARLSENADVRVAHSDADAEVVDTPMRTTTTSTEIDFGRLDEEDSDDETDMDSETDVDSDADELVQNPLGSVAIRSPQRWTKGRIATHPERAKAAVTNFKRCRNRIIKSIERLTEKWPTCGHIFISCLPLPCVFLSSPSQRFGLTVFPQGEETCT